MKTLYIECSMGAAGDMLMAALLELVPDAQTFITKLNGLNIPGVKAEACPAVKCGITGTHISVTVNGAEEESCDAHIHEHGHEHSHSGMDDIAHILSHLNISENVRDHALAVYKLIADAESKAHGKPVSQVHFHEVGAMDAVADIVGVCMLMEQLAPDSIVVSPIHVGSGHVHCAHGILPVPAPATAHILQGVPTYSGQIKGELCTPTGAALLRHFATSFGDMPVMSAEKIGYGMGKKDFDAANCVRIFLGEEKGLGPNGKVCSLSCNIDDMTGEALGYASGLLLKSGALDVFTIPVQMKKSRPGVMLVCICPPEKCDFFAQLILKHTTTFGVRKSVHDRYVLDRSFTKESTPYGEITVKTGSGYGVCKAKREYEDLAALAEANGLALSEI